MRLSVQTASLCLSSGRMDRRRRLSPDASLGYLFFFGRAPIFEDVDGDSLLEVVAMGTEPNSGGNAGTPAGLAYVFAWRNNGQLLNSNFPFTVPDRNLPAKRVHGPARGGR